MVQEAESALDLHQIGSQSLVSVADELNYERKRVDEAAAVLKCVFENATAIFEEDEVEDTLDGEE